LNPASRPGLEVQSPRKGAVLFRLFPLAVRVLEAFGGPLWVIRIAPGS